MKCVCSFLFFCTTDVSASHIRSGGAAHVAERKNFKLLLSSGIVLAVEVSILYFRPMRMI